MSHRHPTTRWDVARRAALPASWVLYMAGRIADQTIDPTRIAYEVCSIPFMLVGGVYSAKALVHWQDRRRRRREVAAAYQQVTTAFGELMDADEVKATAEREAREAREKFDAALEDVAAATLTVAGTPEPALVRPYVHQQPATDLRADERL